MLVKLLKSYISSSKIDNAYFSNGKNLSFVALEEDQNKDDLIVVTELVNSLIEYSHFLSALWLKNWQG